MSIKRFAPIIGAALLLVLCFFAGLWIGNRWTFRWLMDVHEREVWGILNDAVGVLAFIHSGEEMAAAGMVEARAQTAIVSLPQGREWDEIQQADRQSLVIAKKYFEAYPPQKANAEFLETLRWIPDEPVDLESCSPAVRHLLEGKLTGTTQ